MWVVGWVGFFLLEGVTCDPVRRAITECSQSARSESSGPNRMTIKVWFPFPALHLHQLLPNRQTSLSLVVSSSPTKRKRSGSDGRYHERSCSSDCDDSLKGNERVEERWE